MEGLEILDFWGFVKYLHGRSQWEIPGQSEPFHRDFPTTSTLQTPTKRRRARRRTVEPTPEPAPVREPTELIKELAPIRELISVAWQDSDSALVARLGSCLAGASLAHYSGSILAICWDFYVVGALLVHPAGPPTLAFHPAGTALFIFSLQVVIDAFRLINANMMVLGHEPRQTTSNLGHLNKPSIQALIHGLNRHYYSITINYRKNELEQKMLLNLHKKSWMEGLTLQDYSEHCKLNETIVKEMLELAKNYNKAVEEEDKMTPEQLAIKNVGKQDPKRHLEEHVDVLMTSNIVQCLAAMLDTVVFQ
ncbi:26S proteasome non-ATPase regulatory subunit 14-like [Sinocyclocheilus rhinocerous]|uniref:26S proteasome non-ATPase regulatory subunit 14-like n=1 Tax=Sinocyclocheilus rhinocerous TaxID=307959 RepID=UPI0007BA636B|nr:PREDICTED: 26S proteasome non-ATPase regulatory subunit 14-like [Sinocyclocheilus rhinocerous]